MLLDKEKDIPHIEEGHPGGASQEANPVEESPSLLRLLSIGLGLWFAVFLVSLVSPSQGPSRPFHGPLKC
jgi:hypothetical protein